MYLNDEPWWDVPDEEEWLAGPLVSEAEIMEPWATEDLC